ncbi:MAG: YaaR family protein [Syntrophomonas sp.]|nr:YaaR family protein [Syntrophomonas sp.]
MKIERNKQELSKYPSLNKTDIAGVKKVTETAFEQELAYRQEAAMQFRIKEILGNIDKLSDNLKRNLNINDLMRYKKLVRDFLKEASSESYQLSKRRGRNRRGRTLLITVNTVDAEVEKLINDFRTNKREPMEILESLDKIRGMLIDLLI